MNFQYEKNKNSLRTFQNKFFCFERTSQKINFVEKKKKTNKILKHEEYVNLLKDDLSILNVLNHFSNFLIK